VTKNLIIKKN